MSHQLELFPIVEQGQDTVIVTVRQLSDTRWIAMIAAGWWQAYGRTRDAAIRKVVEIYGEDL